MSASASFSGTGYVELSTTDANWSKQSGYTGNAAVNGYVVESAALAYVVYQHSWAPASTDYEAQVAITQLASGDGQAGAAVRMQAAAATFYCFLQLQTAGQVRVYKFVAGTPTQLGSSVTHALTTGVPTTLRIRATGSSTTTIKVYDGATEIFSYDDSSSPITTAGKAGFLTYKSREIGSDRLSLDDFFADDVGGGGGGLSIPVVMNQYRQRSA